MTSPKGWPTTKKSDSIIPGFTAEQTKVPAEFATLQNTGSDRIALDTTPRVAYTVTSGNLLEAGTTKRVIKKTGLNARKGDLIKITSGSLIGIDAPILSCPDANTAILATELDSAPSVGDSFELCRYTFFKVDSSGAIVATPGPTQIRNDGLTVEISEDSTGANNIPMPSGLMVQDETGAWKPVVLDQTAPYANRPIPVAITDITGGAVVTVTAGDINVGIKHNGTDPSSVRIGDGTTLAGVTLTNELKVADALLLAEMQKANAKLVSGYCSDLPISDVALTDLYTGQAKKVRLVQNGGEVLKIYKNGVNIGALEAGGKIEFFIDMDLITDKISIMGTQVTTTNLSVNIFN